MIPRCLFYILWLFTLIALIALAWPRCWTWKRHGDVPLPPLEVVTAIEATELRSRLARNSGILAEHVEEVRRLQLAALKRASRRNVTEDRPPLLQCSSRSFSSMSPYEDWCPSSDGHVEKISSASVVIVKDVCLVKGVLVALSSRSAADVHMERKDFSAMIKAKVGMQDHTIILAFDKGNANDPKYSGKGASFADPHTNTKSFFELPIHRITRASYDGVSEVRHHVSRALSLYYHSMKSAISSQGNRTAIFLSHHVEKHITHFLEPVGVMDVAIGKMMKDDCSYDDLSCFPGIDHAISFRIPVTSMSWQDHVLRAVMRDYERKVPIDTRSALHDSVLCFQKAIFPHFFYAIWPPNEDASGFRKSILSYVQARTEWNIWPLEVLPGRKRRILISTRKTKRTIVDVDNLVEIVRSAASILPFEVTVETIFFGSVSVARQIQASYEADILMSIHGADITNMIFQRKGSALIELFPAFFFEPRFVEMASSLGLHYFAWSCTRPTCAMNGDAARFENFVKRKGFFFDNVSGTFGTKAQPLANYRWPYKGFPGYSCTWCSHMACCGELRGAFFGALRELGVAVGDHKSEITDVLYDAFVAVSWMTREEGLAASAALPHARL